ncbi:Adenylosuccinate synthetase, partial [Cladochytrium replicatum]
MISVIIGGQWGDEGKGKLVDILAQDADLCCRCQGGNNAGHTIVVNGTSFDFHMLPSGLVNPKCANLVGNGVVVHVPGFFQELEKTVYKGVDPAGRLFVSDRAHMVFDFHQVVDGLRESELASVRPDLALGTTKKGIGPTYSSKAARSGVRIHHLIGDFAEFEEKFRACLDAEWRRYGKFEYDVDAELNRYKEYAVKIRPYVVDGVKYIHESFAAGKRILVEGSQATMLDIDFGTYPYVTSSSTSVGGVCTGLGVPPRLVSKVYGVVKAYTTRVGAGPFPTEQLNSIGDHLTDVGREYGVTTGRRRRCGWLDLVVVRYSNMINGYDSINLTKLDVLDQLPDIKIGVGYKYNGEVLSTFPADLSLLSKVEVVYETLPGWNTDISNCTSWDELPVNAQKYIKFIEENVGVKVEWIGVGPGRDSTIHRK